MSRVALWNKALAATEITSLFNGYVSQKWSQLSGSQQANATGWWDLAEAAGTPRQDSTANALTLTDHNSVGLDGTPP